MLDHLFALFEDMELLVFLELDSTPSPACYGETICKVRPIAHQMDAKSEFDRLCLLGLQQYASNVMLVKSL